MNFSRNKFARLKEWSSQRSTPDRHYFSGEEPYRTRRLSMSELWENIQMGFDNVYEKVRNFTNFVKPNIPRSQPMKKASNKKFVVLDPKDRPLQKWNKIFVVCCVLAISLDPLFFYIPVIDNARSCLDLDKTLEIIACVLRTCVDLFYILHIVLQFRTGFIAPNTRVFGRGELVTDVPLIAKRYLFSYFLIDVLSVLPVPQIILLITPNLEGPIPLVTKEALKYTVLIQYIPRLMRIYPLYKEVTRTSGIFAERAWTGAVFNLVLYMLASHVFGAFWYLLSIERRDECWRRESRRLEQDYKILYCGKITTPKNTFLDGSCPLIKSEDITNSTTFDFGIFLDALQSGVVDTRDFTKKLFYCFWWGLRNLSSLGQNLKTSTFVGEIIFAVCISVFGLLLFSLLIGNMQTYLQSTTVRVEEMRVKRQDAEQWMSHRMLPNPLRERVRRYEQYKWQETRGVEEDRLIESLPKDLKRDIKRHLCLNLLMKVPMFEKMDERLLDAMCLSLKPVLYTQKSLILREGDPVDEIVFLMRGDSMTMTTSGQKSGFISSVYLRPGDFCGEELLTWALDPHSSPVHPTSTRTVQAVSEVEAFGLSAEDLKLVASQYRHLHSKQLKHMFKYYSQHWKTWAAYFIQAVWRRHCRWKSEKSLREEEDRLRAALANETESAPSIRATIFAAKFASNALKALRRNSSHMASLQPKRMLPLVPSKPVEPDFSSTE